MYMQCSASKVQSVLLKWTHKDCHKSAQPLPWLLSRCNLPPSILVLQIQTPEWTTNQDLTILQLLAAYSTSASAQMFTALCKDV